MDGGKEKRLGFESNGGAPDGIWRTEFGKDRSRGVHLPRNEFMPFSKSREANHDEYVAGLQAADASLATGLEARPFSASRLVQRLLDEQPGSGKKPPANQLMLVVN